jgi:hypothetical protein
MWWKKKDKKKEEEKGVEIEKKEESLLQELCGDDSTLYDFTCNNLYENPLTAISQKDLASLTEEAEKSGNFTPVIDKAIFEGSQNPEEREKYIKVIQNIASKSIQATEQEKEKAEKAGLTDRAAFLGKRIGNQKLMSERAEDIINVATKFYNEKLVELGEESRREARIKERKTAESDEWRAGQLEGAAREARRKEISKMSGEEKREAERQYKKEGLAAEERKTAREEEKRTAEKEEGRLEQQEKAERESRRKDLGGN